MANGSALGAFGRFRTQNTGAATPPTGFASLWVYGPDGALYQTNADGAHSKVGFGHFEAIWGAMTTAGSGGNGNGYLDVVFSTPFDETLGVDGYEVAVIANVTDAGPGGISLSITNKSPTGCRIVPSATFNGEIRGRAW